VKWRESGATTLVQQDAEPVPGAPGTFRLPPKAYGRDIEIDILKDGVIVVRKRLELAGDSTLRINLSKEPAYREDGR